MLVELIGCTGAGKTTLATKMVQAGRERGLDVWQSDDFVVGRTGFHRVKSEFARRRIIEAYATFAFPALFRKQREFFRFVFRVGSRVRGSWPYRVGVIRVALRKPWIYETIRRHAAEDQIVLVDNEGMLQAAHTLLVHTDSPPSPSDLEEFASFVPLPDVILYLRESEPVLVQRTLDRGHPRIARTFDNVIPRFIRRAMETFDSLHTHPRLAERLLVIDGERITAPGKDIDPRMAKIRDLVQAALGGGARSRPGGQHRAV